MLDTHAWLWWVSEPTRLSPRARDAIDSAPTIGISTMSCWEVATLVRRERIALTLGAQAWIAGAMAIERVVPLPVGVGTATEAGMLGDEFPGDPADRVIYAGAREAHAPLVTKDRRLREFDPDGTVW